jgi:hypothetical protein
MLGQIIRTSLAVAAILTTPLSLAANSHTEESASNGTAADLGGPITLDGVIGIQDVFKSISTGNSLNTPYLAGTIVLDAKISESVRARIMLLAVQNLVEMGATPQKIEKLLYEANIRISNVGGTPVAFVIGKQSVSFGQTLMKLPNASSDPSKLVTGQSEVIGLTISLEDVGFFNLVEASVFETTGGDLSIGEFDGGSIRLTKKVSDKLKVQVSTMHAGHGNGPNENRQSVGLILNEGSWSFWAQGIHIDGSTYFPNTHWSSVAGFDYKWNNQRIVVQALYLSDAFTSLSIGYQIEIIKDVSISPEARYVMRSNGTKELQYIITTNYRFSTR